MTVSLFLYAHPSTDVFEWQMRGCHNYLPRTLVVLILPLIPSDSEWQQPFIGLQKLVVVLELGMLRITTSTSVLKFYFG